MSEKFSCPYGTSIVATKPSPSSELLGYYRFSLREKKTLLAQETIFETKLSRPFVA